MPPTADSTVNPDPHNRMGLSLSVYPTVPLDCRRKPQEGQGEVESKASGWELDCGATSESFQWGDLGCSHLFPPKIPGMMQRDRFLLEAWGVGWEGQERCREGSGDRRKGPNTTARRTYTFRNPLSPRTYNVPVPREVQLLFGAASVSRIRWCALTCG